jgi:hypothetical protein
MVNDILKYHRQLIEEKLIGRLLVRKELLTEDKYREALEKRCQERKPLGQILVENHYLTPKQVRDAFDRFLISPILIWKNKISVPMLQNYYRNPLSG